VHLKPFRLNGWIYYQKSQVAVEKKICKGFFFDFLAFLVLKAQNLVVKIITMSTFEQIFATN